MASRSRSPPPSPDELKWACGACAVLNSLYSNSCGACETRRPLERPVEVDADSPVVVAATPAPAPRRRRRKKRDRAPAVAEAERPVEVDADSPIVAADASASPPLKACGRKRECDPAVSVADRPVEVDADSPVVVATTPASAPRRRRRKKKDRAPAVAEEERPVEVDASASPHLRVRGGKRKRAASLDVVEICDSAGREGGGEGKAPAAKKGNLGIHFGKTFKIMTYNIWFREDMELSRRMDAIVDLIKHHNPDLICFQVPILNFVSFSIPLLSAI
nr:unnamed protein product [Digitaria exilis]